MRLLLIFILLKGITISVNAQSENTYQALINKASLYHLQKNSQAALNLYEQAFQIQAPDALTAYKAAGMYALDSNANKAFKYLETAVSTGWTETDWLSFDPYFNYLRTAHPESWKKIEREAFIQEEIQAKTLQLPTLRKDINLMVLADQKLRYERIHSDNERTRLEIDQEIIKSDQTNLNKARIILHQYGWPKISQIGRDGQNNLWLIVQHADQDLMLQETALKAMEKLKGTKEFNKENYAFLYDRVQCNLNYKQLYGTQVIWTSNGEASAFRPMVSEYMVDERRRDLGLESLQLYALNYGFTYQKLTNAESKEKDIQYKLQVRQLIDSAKHFFAIQKFEKMYDYYNAASTFIGGMSNADNLEAAIFFSKTAVVHKDDKYKSIALDFLGLLQLRGVLTKSKLASHPEFKVLYNEQRWITMLRTLTGMRNERNREASK